MDCASTLCICKIGQGKGLLIVVNPNLSLSPSSSTNQLNHSRIADKEKWPRLGSGACRAFARVPRR